MGSNDEFDKEKLEFLHKVAGDNVDRLKNRFRYYLNHFPSEDWCALEGHYDRNIRQTFCNIKLDVDIEGDDEKQVIGFDLVLPIRIPVMQRESVRKLFDKINGSIGHGYYDVDMETGELWFRSDDTAAHYPDFDPDDCYSIITPGLAIVDQHFLSIMNAGFGNVGPATEG